MDRIIQSFVARVDGDLVFTDRGVAYQADMSHRVQYDDAYFNKCRSYEGQDVAEKINRARVELVHAQALRFPMRGPSEPVLDIGVGSGEFVAKRPKTFGFDINPSAVQWLSEHGLYRDDLSQFRMFTMWDVIEHVEDPGEYFGQMRVGSILCTSIPIIEELENIRQWKHYRPGEHLYYFTHSGFIDWMALHDFDLFCCNSYETDAGREDIESFAFRRCAPRMPAAHAMRMQAHV